MGPWSKLQLDPEMQLVAIEYWPGHCQLASSGNYLQMQERLTNIMLLTAKACSS